MNHWLKHRLHVEEALEDLDLDEPNHTRGELWQSSNGYQSLRAGRPGTNPLRIRRISEAAWLCSTRRYLGQSMLKPEDYIERGRRIYCGLDIVALGVEMSRSVEDWWSRNSTAMHADGNGNDVTSINGIEEQERAWTNTRAIENSGTGMFSNNIATHLAGGCNTREWLWPFVSKQILDLDRQGETTIE